MPEDITAEVPAPAETTPDKDPILDALTETESAPEEPETPSEEPKEDADETKEDESSEEDDKSENPDEQGKTEDPKEPEEDPKEKARRMYEERQRLAAERRARIEKKTLPYIEAGENENEQRIRAIESRDYERLIEHNETTLQGEFERVKANPDLQIFNPDNKESFNRDIYDYATRTYNDAYIEYDDVNNPIGLKKSLYEHLTETAELYNKALKAGQIKQVRDSRKVKTNADTTPAAPPKENTAKDPVLDILLSD